MKKKTNVEDARNKIKQMFKGELIKELKNLYISNDKFGIKAFGKYRIRKDQSTNLYTVSSNDWEQNYEFINVDISKQVQSSDFGGELTSAQLKYCANDVIYLHKIHDELIKILKREKREVTQNMILSPVVMSNSSRIGLRSRVPWNTWEPE